MKILYSKEFVDSETLRLKQFVDTFEYKPKLAIIVAKDYSNASSRYVKNKHNIASKIGVDVVQYDVEWENVDENEFSRHMFDLIDNLNNDDSVDGIIVQLPVPYLPEYKISKAIIPSKDVDGFHSYNLGNVMRGLETFVSCTPKGIIDLMKYHKVDFVGKTVCIIGRSNIVGKPLANLLINHGATVISCNSMTDDLKKYTKISDIVICAIGKAKYFDKSYFNENCIIIDVGINFDENGKMCGDVDFDNVKDYVKAITPVPGGVGPCTVLSLMKNTIQSSVNKKNSLVDI